MMPYQRLTKKVGDRYMYIHAGLGQEGLNRLGELEDEKEKQEKEKKEGNTQKWLHLKHLKLL